MVGRGGAVDLDNLFEPTEIDEEVPKPPPEPPSAAFLQMAEKVSARIDRRTKQKRQPRTMAASKFDRARVEVRAMAETGDWNGIDARHLVALFDLMHCQVYGIESGDGPAERFKTMMMAKALVEREFSGDYEAGVRYMHWAWSRENEKERWARDNGRPNTRRLTPWVLFANKPYFTDYRLYLVRTGRKP